MTYELVNENNPILTKSADPFSFSDPPMDPSELTDIMSDMLEKHFGLGLAAPQIGLPYRMFIMRGESKNITCFNPRLVTLSNEVISLEETSLTHPGITIKVKRPRTIRVRYQNEFGVVNTNTFTNMTARIFLQGMDSLDGVLFFNRANRYHKEQAFKKRNKPETSK